jgi:hypothetical protein
MRFIAVPTIEIKCRPDMGLPLDRDVWDGRPPRFFQRFQVVCLPEIPAFRGRFELKNLNKFVG